MHEQKRPGPAGADPRGGRWVVYLRNPLFLSPNNLANTANLIGLFGLFSIAQGFVIITGGIELSVGSMIALLGVLFVDLVGNKGVPWPIAALIVMFLGLMLGLAHGLAHHPAQNAALRGDALRPADLSRRRARLHAGRHGRLPLRQSAYPDLDSSPPAHRRRPDTRFIAAWSSSRSIAWVVLHRSVFGRYLFAVGKNEEAARFSGIRTGLVIVAAYVICAGLTALAAIFFAMYTRSVAPSSHGNFYELYAIAAAVLGGFSLRGGEGSIIGVVLGTILLQVLQNLVNLLGIPSSLNFAVMGTRHPHRRARRPAMERISLTPSPHRVGEGIRRADRTVVTSRPLAAI